MTRMTDRDERLPGGAGPGGADAVVLADQAADRPVLRSERVFEGRVWDVVRDEVAYDERTRLTREYLEHPGAVAVVALDTSERVLLIRQYRHPVRERMWEVPAGLLDVAGESPWDAARRELAEETD